MQINSFTRQAKVQPYGRSHRPRAYTLPSQMKHPRMRNMPQPEPRPLPPQCDPAGTASCRHPLWSLYSCRAFPSDQRWEYESRLDCKKLDLKIGFYRLQMTHLTQLTRTPWQPSSLE